ncbi:unnamed protein product [Effrenium voratum]|uniref:Uncharacterized protein n=1 Tax=Effrenium voratum TaxID=2562239 RepID=A0AA36HRB1_9DINO|nr:unnamed protein product [Effrenium voratum]CAJ1435189.1 unnamed protein product [Effrenium voratum]
MPIIHRLLDHVKDDEDLDKVREEVMNCCATMGVVAALLLTMEKTSVNVDKLDLEHDWLDCSVDGFPCQNVHIALSWLSLACCAHAVLCTTCVYVWLCMIPKQATRDFFFTFPLFMHTPSMTMMGGTFFWAADFFFLMVVRNGTGALLWLGLPALALGGHILYVFLRMRYFCWNWPDCGYRQIAPDAHHRPGNANGAAKIMQ